MPQRAAKRRHRGHLLGAGGQREPRRLLRFSDLTVEAVGREVGIPEPGYFSRVFKKVEGVAPGDLGAVLWVPALGHDTGQEAGNLLIDAHVPDIVLRARQGQELGEQAGESGCAVCIIYTASPFAKANLLYLQEAGELRALKPHVNSRLGLRSFLFFLARARSSVSRPEKADVPSPWAITGPPPLWTYFSGEYRRMW